MQHDKVSIIIPSFNASAAILTCLESVVCQSYRNLEIVVIDGGSKDDTVAIVERYAAQYGFVRCVSEPDRGIYDAMNKGVALTTGRWLYFMGADDQLFNATTIENVSTYFNGATDFLYGNAATGSRLVGGPFDRDKIIRKTICHQAILYRRDLLERVGPYNLAFKVCADWDLNIRCFAADCEPKHIDQTICRYGGSGFSSFTTDHVFLERKLQKTAGYFQVSYWNRLFRSSRFEFHAQAVQRRQTGRLISAVRYYTVYLFHSVLAKVSRSP